MLVVQILGGTLAGVLDLIVVFFARDIVRYARGEFVATRDIWPSARRIWRWFVVGLLAVDLGTMLPASGLIWLAVSPSAATEFWVNQLLVGWGIILLVGAVGLLRFNRLYQMSVQTYGPGRRGAGQSR